jgi:putative transposase
VFVVLEVGTRRIVHWNVTAHPTAEWTAQQFRMIVPGDQVHRFVIHDRDSIYSEGIDRTLASMGLTVLKTPVRAPQANAFCERVIGTIRRECMDFMIPMTERHVRATLQEWVRHYNRGRPHASLGPGIPEGSVVAVVRQKGVAALLRSSGAVLSKLSRPSNAVERRSRSRLPPPYDSADAAHADHQHCAWFVPELPTRRVGRSGDVTRPLPA